MQMHHLSRSDTSRYEHAAQLLSNTQDFVKIDKAFFSHNSQVRVSITFIKAKYIIP